MKEQGERNMPTQLLRNWQLNYALSKRSGTRNSKAIWPAQEVTPEVIICKFDQDSMIKKLLYQEHFPIVNRWEIFELIVEH